MAHQRLLSCKGSRASRLTCGPVRSRPGIVRPSCGQSQGGTPVRSERRLSGRRASSRRAPPQTPGDAGKMDRLCRRSALGVSEPVVCFHARRSLGDEVKQHFARGRAIKSTEGSSLRSGASSGPVTRPSGGPGIQPARTRGSRSGHPLRGEKGSAPGPPGCFASKVISY